MSTPTIDAPAVEFRGDDMAIRFDRFGIDAYDLFLRLKAIPEKTPVFDPESESYTIVAAAWNWMLDQPAWQVWTVLVGAGRCWSVRSSW